MTRNTSQWAVLVIVSSIACTAEAGKICPMVTGGQKWGGSTYEISRGEKTIKLRVQVPKSGNTYGAVAWARTVQDFNDGKKHIVNFKWKGVVDTVGKANLDEHIIQITDGWHNWQKGGLYDHNVENKTERPGTRNLFLMNGEGTRGEREWSIVFHPDSVAPYASLYGQTDGRGIPLGKVQLRTGDPWHIRFLVTAATSAGFPAKDVCLYLYRCKVKK